MYDSYGWLGIFTPTFLTFLLIALFNITDHQPDLNSASQAESPASDGGEGITGASKRLRLYKCERCAMKFMGLAVLRQHCREVHGDQKYYKCNVCGKLFSHPSSRNIHLRLHSGEKPYECETCGKRFRVSSHLKDHIRVHTGELGTFMHISFL